MEIRNYVRIAWRRLWLIVGLPALVVAFSLLRPAPPRATSYVASMRFSVGVWPERLRSDTYTYDRYYTWLTAEYLVDDLSEVVKSREMADAVMAEARREGLTAQIAPGAIQGATTGGKLHRILSVSMSWGNPDELTVLANSLAKVLTEGQAAYFVDLRAAGTPVMMHLIDPPSIAPVGQSLRSRLDLPLRLLLALLAGVTLAFFLEYVDDSVRGPQDLRTAGLEVLASIPRCSALPWKDQCRR